jgi:hypothetical protein
METMAFYFVQDFRRNHRFLSSEPAQEIQIEFSRLKKLWKTAREKLMLLPPRILRQEQAFAKILRIESEDIFVHFAHGATPRRIKLRFFFFLQKQRTKHILLLVIEALLAPISGLMALLPGPNVFFGFLALLMITHWQAFRGINQLRKKNVRFLPSDLLGEWEQVVDKEKTADYSPILNRIEIECKVSDVHRILYK